ncbi:glycosyltransferase [Roseomonas soli]|uniref:Glycosyltransferase n=2 Tax=Neoroseomonas soli TaxID=1081025 RepID=A0A9X9WX67_9PROT|nr:glycosyltransferase [Neoroseomonas soli]
MTNLRSAYMSPATLSIIVPCFDEERTLQSCIERVLELKHEDDLSLEIIIVDDCSRDRSLAIARELEARHPEIRVLQHVRNQGKGAALRTGFREATGEFVAVQDADLEYNPLELRKLVEPLRDGRADVVIGSRFKGSGPHRVLYFWHYVGNAILTFLSNMFTDLNLTDMESCYKVFRREAIRDIQIEEDRFGFEPEIVAKVAHKKLRIYEMAISYDGRTYAEGKKINWRDGVRALYCIFRYNSYHLPLPIQFFAYLVIGFIAGLVNLAIFLGLLGFGVSLPVSTLSAFVIAAAVNYFLCIALLFRHKARWKTTGEIIAYILVVATAGVVDLGITSALVAIGTAAWLAKILASIIGVVLNYLGRRYLVF